MTQEDLDRMSEEEQGEFWFCWEEQDWMDNRLMYENELEYLEELPKREKK